MGRIMDFRHQISLPGNLSSLPADALLLVLAGEAIDASLDTKLASALNDALAEGDLKLKAGRSLYLHRLAGVKAPRVLASASGGTGVKAFKAAVLHGLNQLKGLGAQHVAVALVGGELDDQHAEAVVTAAADATYLYRHTKPSAPAASSLNKVTLVCSKGQAKSVQAGLLRGQAISAGVTLARECANRPGNHCTPSYLADQAKKLGKSHQLKVEVLDRKDVEKLGMGSFLAVAQGSSEPLRFIVARYDGAPKTQAPVVLVGKGITFDTGGISIKPSLSMHEMKSDMGGAAAALGAIVASARLGLDVAVTSYLCIAENMPSGSATKPGDVLHTYGGTTIEVLDTDAEGRLVLADGLARAQEDKPDVLIDIATLTGAAVIALGARTFGIMANDDGLRTQIHDAAGRVGEASWPMPQPEELRSRLDSHVADIANIPLTGRREGGMLSASIFLREFVKPGQKWAHLDIAGPAYNAHAAHDYTPRGGTGAAVRTLVQVAADLASGS